LYFEILYIFTKGCNVPNYVKVNVIMLEINVQKLKQSKSTIFWGKKQEEEKGGISSKK